jgi:nitrite reductase/ring-hydroxylating ferredoxin subunit
MGAVASRRPVAGGFPPGGRGENAGVLGRSLADRLPFLDALADAAQPPVRAFLKARLPLRDALDGTWLGTPLHPPLTDVPVGAATAAALLDLTGQGEAGDRALAVSVAATLPTALTGIGDWRDLRGGDRRVATLHAVLNVAALALNVRSLALRARGRRAAGVLTSLGALGIVSLSAHIGGELSFGRGLRVNRNAWEASPDDWRPVAAADELTEHELRTVEIDGEQVVVARTSGGEVCAIGATCSHLGGPLGEGAREGDTVVCPWHGSTFDLCTGEVVHGPATFAQPRYEVRQHDQHVEVRRLQ